MKRVCVARLSESLNPARPAEAGSAAEPGIWNRHFMVLFVASALGYAHFGLLGPIVPLYLDSLGQTEWVVGLVVASFAFTSFLVRPVLGYLTDTLSVRGVLSAGGFVIGFSSLAFLTPALLVLALVNAIRGIGWSALNTGANTFLAHTAPSGRRGEAAGLLTVSHSGPSLLAPPVALWLLTDSGNEFGRVFMLGALLGLGAGALGWTLPSPRVDPPPAAASIAASGSVSSLLDRLVDRAVLLPTVLLVCLALVQPAVAVFIPLLARQRGISLDSLVWYYLIAAVASLFGRSLLGQVADRAGRGVALAAGFVLAMLGLGLLAIADNLAILTVAGVLCTLASALNQPATTALAIDRADPRRRGRAMASYSLGNQLGAGFGAMLAGAVAEWFGYGAMYGVMLLAPLAGLVLVAANWRSLRTQPGA